MVKLMGGTLAMFFTIPPVLFPNTAALTLMADEEGHRHGTAMMK